MNIKMTVLEEHMKVVMKITDKTIEALEFYQNGDEAQVKAATKEILKLEAEADILRNSIQKRWSLQEGPRKYSAMELVETIDLIADYCEDVALLMEMRPGSIPQSISLDFGNFVKKVHSTVEMLSQAVSVSSKFSKKYCRDCESFDRLYEGSEVGKCAKLDSGHTSGLRSGDAVCEIEKAEVLFVMCDDIGVKEEEADVMERKFRAMAFKEELGLNPIQTLHFLQIVNNTDYIANSAKDAANALRRLY